MASDDISVPDGPVRTCVGCRRRAAKRELLRVTVGSEDGHDVVSPDPTATAPGRGAHLHPDRSCYDLAVRRKAFPRALRHTGELSHVPLDRYLDQQPTRDPENRPPHAAEPTRKWSSSS